MRAFGWLNMVTLYNSIDEIDKNQLRRLMCAVVIHPKISSVSFPSTHPDWRVHLRERNERKLHRNWHSKKALSQPTNKYVCISFMDKR